MDKLATSERKVAIFVDLDGSLVKTDLLWESFYIALRRPLVLLSLLKVLRRGRPQFKQSMARRISLRIDELPYRNDVLEFLKKQRSVATIILATASDKRWANDVATHVGLFDDVLASDGSLNLKGCEKLAAIEDYCRNHNISEYAYVGDSTADLPIWEKAGQIYVVAPSGMLRSSIKGFRAPVREFGVRPSRLKLLGRVLRPHQWAKNVLLFAPLLLAHELTDLAMLFRTFAAFVSFSLAASAVYVLNDLLDVGADRKHYLKQRRPFASGDLPLAWGLPLILTLASGGVIVAAFVGKSFAIWLAIYLAATTGYTFDLKKRLLLDVIALAGLYTLRILAGGSASGVPVSEWLLAFSMFLFTSLAFAKRYVEVSQLVQTSGTHGRAYLASDLGIIESVGPATGLMAVLVLSLYIQHSPAVLYSNPFPLWLICPLLMYWILRLWFFAKRRALAEDPVVFAVTDRVSIFIAVLAGVLVYLASMPRL